jgi:hypothetical protein
MRDFDSQQEPSAWRTWEDAEALRRLAFARRPDSPESLSADANSP